jgi:hypothetical protein
MSLELRLLVCLIKIIITCLSVFWERVNEIANRNTSG